VVGQLYAGAASIMPRKIKDFIEALIKAVAAAVVLVGAAGACFGGMHNPLSNIKTVPTVVLALAGVMVIGFISYLVAQKQDEEAIDQSNHLHRH
jgi:ABC-type xylose transport system permease subunit